jgi:hypothetical protein
MTGSVTSYLRSNILGLVAIFIALGGSAFAVGLAKNSVKSKQIKDGAVNTSDLADNAVTSPKVADGSLLGRDFAAGQLPVSAPGSTGATGPQGLAGSPDTPQQVLDKIEQVDGAGSGLEADIGANTLTGTQVNEATLDSSSFVLGRAAAHNDSTNCVDSVSTEVCASTTLQLPRSARVLLSMSGNWAVTAFDGASGLDNTTYAEGYCRVLDNAVEVPDTRTRVGEQQVTAGALPWSSGGSLWLGPMATTTVTAPLAAGAHVFGAQCIEDDGDISWLRVRIAAVMLGNG